MLFFAIILIIGILTTFTDLKNKKIYNPHLLIGAGLGILATAYATFFRHENIIFHITNGLVAFLVGFILHRTALWRGGDAKLFALYAFLMPPPLYHSLPFPSAVSLFACSFIAGTVILMPVFIKDIIIHRRAIVNDLFLPTRLLVLLRGVTRVILYSWILLPLYYLTRMTNPAVMLIITYLIFSWRNKITKTVKEDYVRIFFKKNFIQISLSIIAGLLMRIFLAPDSLSFPSLVRYIMMITVSIGTSICIHTTFNHFENYHERVPFAPLLFIGCVLSYTPFLVALTHLLIQWNVLLYY